MSLSHWVFMTMSPLWVVFINGANVKMLLCFCFHFVFAVSVSVFILVPIFILCLLVGFLVSFWRLYSFCVCCLGFYIHFVFAIWVLFSFCVCCLGFCFHFSAWSLYFFGHPIWFFDLQWDPTMMIFLQKWNCGSLPYRGNLW